MMQSSLSTQRYEKHKLFLLLLDRSPERDIDFQEIEIGEREREREKEKEKESLTWVGSEGRKRERTVSYRVGL